MSVPASKQTRSTTRTEDRSIENEPKANTRSLAHLWLGMSSAFCMISRHDGIAKGVVHLLTHVRNIYFVIDHGPHHHQMGEEERR